MADGGVWERRLFRSVRPILVFWR